MILFIACMILLRIFVLAAIVLGIYKLVSFVQEKDRLRSQHLVSGEKKAIQILKARFASGEIDESEYEARLKVLRLS